MNFKMLALSAQSEAAASKMLARISGAFSGFTEDTEFAVYETLKALLPPFAEALKSSQGIVLAIQKSKYNAVRTKLCAALALETAQDARLYDVLSKKSGAAPEEMQKNAVVPKDAAIFASGDGMYPGFAVKKGKQIIFFLPLDPERLDGMLKGGVVPFMLQQTAKQAPQQPEEKKQVPVHQEEDMFADSVLQRTINILRENGQSVAVSSTPTSSYIKALATQRTVDFDRFFIFTPHVEDKGDYNLTDYAALLAKSAKELAGTPYGACISEVSTSDGGDSIYITVADDKTALVRKLYREDDETTEDFLHDAAEELVELIGEKAAGKGAVGIEVASVDTTEKKGGFLSKKSGKITVSVIAIVLVAAIVTGSIFFVREKRAREAQAAEEASRAAAAAAATTAPTTEIAKPVIETVPLSQLIYNEAINGIQETPAEVTTESADGSAIDTSATAGTNTSEIPDTIIVNGESLDAKEAVARIVEAEMDSTYNEEALKAQAVVVYTYLKYRNTNWKITGVTLAEDYSDEVYNAVRSVFGEYLSFNDAPAFTPFFKLSAGKTVAAETVFGKSFPYLRAVDSLSDRTQEGYKNELIFSASDVKAMLTAYDETLTLGEDPNEWIKVTAHSGAVNTGIGYVQTVSIGGKEVSGMDFVNKVMAGKNLTSECFAVEYNTPTDEFTFTVYGIGHGVGLSQMGADKMAATGSTYVQILSKYYSGTTLTA